MRYRVPHAFWYLLLIFVGCGGSRSDGGGGSSPSGTSVSFTFTGAPPQAAAVQTGSGPFTAAPLRGNELDITVPDGTSKYAVAWVCPPPGGNLAQAETVINATLQDGTAFTMNCGAVAGPPQTFGAATGSVDASAIIGATKVVIQSGPFSGMVNAVSRPFSANLLSGTDDIGVLAEDPGGNVLAAKILRGQTVPGAINSGNTITFGSADLTTSQQLTVTGQPPLNFQLGVGVIYSTPVSTFGLSNNSTSYQAVPAAAMQSGDSYQFVSTLSAPSLDFCCTAQTMQLTTSAQSVTLNTPVWMTPGGPLQAAAFPTFSFGYQGFSGMATITQAVSINTQFGAISVLATGSFQAGATTVTVPNLSAIPGFFPASAPGALVGWSASITAGSGSEKNFRPSLTTDGPPVSFVSISGNYNVP